MSRYEYSETERAVLERSVVPYAIYQFVDKRVVTILISDGLLEFLGYGDRQETIHVLDEDMYRDTHPDDVARISDDAYKFATEGGQYDVIYRSKVNGEYKVIHAFGRHICPEEGVVLAIVWYVDEGTYIGDELAKSDSLTHDFSVSLYESSLVRKNNFDFLTGLPNMTYFFELTRVSREHVLEKGGNCTLGYANLNGMKYYNKKHGFAEGDKLLRDFAEILIKYFGSEHSCRIGQDNFAFFSETDNLEEILDSLIKDVEKKTGERAVSVRVGLYHSSMGIVDSSNACDRARYACNYLRNTNRSGYMYFNESMLEYETNRQYVVDNLDKALTEGWITAYYQPIVRAANGRVCDEEALARWIDPVKGMMSPAEFIPILEDAKLIYKVDLFIVDQIIEKIKGQIEAGLYVVPMSVNLSRTDFDTCDIVAEICSRVDAAGVDRGKLTIEITESVVGSDFEFMKKQVERFQELGFRVWMDDFGSGYSSLDLLQSMHFNLIKLDMRFMKQFDNSDKSRVIVTELMKMAVGLGIETVTEGVETEEQVEFLREVGCTKLQGFYYCKPIPFEEILKRNEEGRQIGFENPAESEYFEALGRINLYDMSSVANENPESFGTYFDTAPMAVIETNDKKLRVVRCNKSYREFLDNAFGPLEVGTDVEYEFFKSGYGDAFANAIKRCAKTGDRTFINERFSSDSMIYAFVTRIAVNPVTNVVACSVIILGIIKNTGRAVTYSDIASSLSADYIDLYYVNLKTEDFVEYSPDPSNEALSVERHGRDFFKNSKKDANKFLYKEDVDKFLASFTRDKVLKAIDEHGAFIITYRQIIGGTPTYLRMKAIRMTNDEDHIIIGVNNVDSQLRQKRTIDRLRAEKITYSRISALSGNYLCIYTVDPETDMFTEYGATSDYAGLELEKVGEDFFEKAREYSKDLVHPDDLGHLLKRFTRENVFNDIKTSGMFMVYYRLLIKDVYTYVSLRAAMVEEEDGPQLIVGICNIDSQVRKDMEKDAE